MSIKRICEGCLVCDDAPKHIFYQPGGGHDGDASRLAGRTDLDAAAIAEFIDTNYRHFHKDCCAERGCPDGSCVLNVVEV